MNRTDETIESIAKIVYSAMCISARQRHDDPPEWVERGNSDMQDEARRAAYQIAFRKGDGLDPDALGLQSCEVAALREMAAVGEFYALNFRGLSNRTGLNRQIIRGTCRSLAERGLARFRNGLFSEDEFMTAGSGYSITEAGLEIVRKLDEMTRQEGRTND